MGAITRIGEIRPLKAEEPMRAAEQPSIVSLSDGRAVVIPPILEQVPQTDTPDQNIRPLQTLPHVISRTATIAPLRMPANTLNRDPAPVITPVRGVTEITVSRPSQAPARPAEQSNTTTVEQAGVATPLLQSLSDSITEATSHKQTNDAVAEQLIKQGDKAAARIGNQVVAATEFIELVNQNKTGLTTALEGMMSAQAELTDLLEQIQSMLQDVNGLDSTMRQQVQVIYSMGVRISETWREHQLETGRRAAYDELARELKTEHSSRDDQQAQTNQKRGHIARNAAWRTHVDQRIAQLDQEFKDISIQKAIEEFTYQQAGNNTHEFWKPYQAAVKEINTKLDAFEAHAEAAHLLQQQLDSLDLPTFLQSRIQPSATRRLPATTEREQITAARAPNKQLVAPAQTPGRRKELVAPKRAPSKRFNILGLLRGGN